VTQKIEEVEHYLEQLDSERRSALAQVRSLVLETVPEAVESMKYKMPTYNYREAVLCAFASQKHYMSLYVEPRNLDRHRTELQHLDLAKSCIRFKSLEQLPLELVRTILEETVQAIDADLSHRTER
jgi:uncharacterized protein YdhG (YjbR/CyaY superfamily)